MNVSSLISSDQTQSVRGSAPSYFEYPRRIPSPSAPHGFSASPYSPAARLPLSPPADDGKTKYSLPSISALLQGVDTVSDAPIAKRQRVNPPPHIELGADQGFRQKTTLPLTPPLRPESSLNGASRSPSAQSPPRSAIALPSLMGGYPSPISDGPEGRRMSQISQRSRGTSISQSSQILGPESRYPSPPNAHSPSFAVPMEPSPKASEFYPQTGRPASYPLIPFAVLPTQPTHPQMIALGSPAWQHHHYFPPSNTAAYPLNHDRYICRICHKAFSRPSSLRIHSHSHTGEKPFRCPHSGCGKAFSVRSNMKRHERGCHPGRANAQSTLVN